MSEQEELKARLMQDVEALIDQMLAKGPRSEEIRLRETEKSAVATGEKVKAVIVQHLLDSHQEQAEGVKCPHCGKRLGMKDYRSRQVVTEAGEVQITRAYYYCEECRAGIFPPG